MMKINLIRYAIQMRNGGFMRQEYDGSFERVRVDTVDIPISGDLFKKKKLAEEMLNDILTGNTSILCLYDDDNPPEKVVEVKLDVQVE